MNTRRKFIKDLAAAAVATSALSTLACGGDDDTAGMMDGGMDGGMNGGEPAFNCTSGLADITDNHGHVFDMTLTDSMIANPADISVLISAATQADQHPHTITLTAADITTLSTGGTVTVTSTVDGDFPHDHDVTVTCSAV